MGDGIENIKGKIRSFQKRYYLNILIRGVIFTLSAILSYFLLAAFLEYSLWMAPWGRLSVFIVFFIILFYCAYRYLKTPLMWWIAQRGLDEQESARIIGNHLPSVRDRLLNFIQLLNKEHSSLAMASIRQKSLEFEPIAFEKVVDLRDNRKFLRYLLIPAALILLVLLINQQIITQSTRRIIYFNEEFSPQAPFNFLVTNKSLTAFSNEDFNLNVRLEGKSIPADVYLLINDQRFKLDAAGRNEFSYVFENVQEPFTFQLEAAGFFSSPYSVQLVNRPELTGFKITLDYPKYLGRKSKELINAGNLEIPEGTVVNWNLSTANASAASILFSSEKSPFDFQQTDNDYFTYLKKFTNPDQYEIFLQNDNSKNKERIKYHVDVIKDQFPQLAINNFKDSVLYKHIVLGGIIADDYGLTELSLNFKIKDENDKDVLTKSVKIPIIRNQPQQSFIHNWSVDSLDLKPGHKLEYYLKVWDNDGVNGRKSTRSATYNFLIPTQDKLVADIDQSRNQTQQKLDQSTGNAQKLQDKIEEAYQRLKGKQSLDWQDKKMLQDIVQQKNDLDHLIDDIKQKNELLEEKKSAFTEQDERIKEKAEQLQKLMDELLDEETKKLFEELEKLMNENADLSQIQKILDKLNQNTDNLEKELERTLELFKQLQYDFKLDQTIRQLQEQIEKQKSLLEKTEQLKESGKEKGEQNKAEDQKGDQNEEQGNENKSENHKLAEEQNKLKEDFAKVQEELEKVKELGEELNKPDEGLPEESDSEEIQNEQQQSKEMLEQNKPSKSKQNQQKALDKMQQMQQQMEGMQSSMQMEMDMENLESLRQIVHGLIKLSHDQEGLIKSFQEIQQNDPRFNGLAQQQLKLKDDSKVLEDSLLALAKRDPYMGSFVTKEIGEMNNHLEKAIEANKERRKPQAQSEMQLTMTAINNLALMLDSHMDMMMQMMGKGKPSMSKSKQKGQKPNLSQLQQQLNNKIQELKNSGKSGRELSEELAKMAAEQERIRRAIEEMQEQMKKEGKNPGGDLPGKMEQTEMDLVNKQLTDQLIKRQKEILTRLLETEKSMREQDLDEERKGETAKDYEKELPRAFEEYLRLKEKEVELLKTVPPKLYPYYKKEVSEYFKRMGNQ